MPLDTQPSVPPAFSEACASGKASLPKNRKGQEVVVISGLSGAGKSTVLHVFEDLRFFTADGVPLELVPHMVRLMCSSSPGLFRGVALGVDQHRMGFGIELDNAVRVLKEQGFKPLLIFLEASPVVLLRRYATTRRPHPMERDGIGLDQAMQEERERLQEVREVADRIIDTSAYSIHDLRRIIQRLWKSETGFARDIKVNIVSFGFKYGVPREADMVFDLRFLPNPYFVEELRALSGMDKEVAEYVFADPQATLFREKFMDFLSFVLPLYDAEGRYRITIAIGCTGGRHRSVALAEALARVLKQHHYCIAVEHRHMELG